MKLWKSVVGKLWMTIIGLVAVVLLINGVFMGQFLDTNIANSKDQERSLHKLAEKVSDNLFEHRDEVHYVSAIGELLEAQDAVLVVLDDKLEELLPAPKLQGLPHLAAFDLFNKEKLQNVLTGGTQDTIYVDPSTGERYLAVAVPYRSGKDGTVHGAVILYQAQLVLNYTQAYFRNLFAIAAVIGFLLTTLFAFFLSSRITQPLLQMKKAADTITLGEYKTRVPVTSSDEIGELAGAFNHMTGRLDETVNALNHEKEHLASVLRSMTDAVMTIDSEGRVVLTNPRGEKLVELWKAIPREDEPAVDGEEREAHPYPLIPGPLHDLFDEVVSANKDMTTNLHVQTGVYSVVMAPLNSAEGVRGVVAVLRDVTEEHRLDKLRKDFVANVSHELRTPLSMLQGYSEALLDDIVSTPEERKELAQVIHDESLRMGRLVKDLLDLARMENGHIELHLREFELDALISRVYRKFAALCKERGLTLQLELEDDLVLYHADEDRLEQVLTNLLDNAVRHTSEGGWIAIRGSRQGKDSIQLEVEDSGCGIPPEDLRYIFERFYKADKARTRVGGSGGTGLGLAIVKSIIDAHQGTIMAHSEAGKGTAFFVQLPNEAPRA